MSSFFRGQARSVAPKWCPRDLEAMTLCPQFHFSIPPCCPTLGLGIGQRSRLDAMMGPLATRSEIS